jgi:hypothetical protein
MSDTDEFESELAAQFEAEYDIDGELAAKAAGKAAAFRDDFDAGLTVQAVLDATATAPYEAFEHRFDRAIGSFADESEDCTDSREYRLAGFDALAADPDQESDQLA